MGETLSENDKTFSDIIPVILELRFQLFQHQQIWKIICKHFLGSLEYITIYRSFRAVFVGNLYFTR